MKKVILENKQKQIYLSDLTDASHVGFIDSNGSKGYIAYTGGNGNDDKFSAICVSDAGTHCNSVYGGDNYKSTLLQALEIEQRCNASLRELFVFDTRKELYRWLGED